MNNCLHAARRILKLFDVPYTGSYLKDALLSHPHYPSLLAIADTLDKYGISQLAVKIGKEKLDQVPFRASCRFPGPGWICFTF